MNAQKSTLVPWWLAVALALLFALSLGYFGYLNYTAGSGAWEIAGSTLLLAVPIGMLCLSTGILVVAARQRRAQGFIGPRLGKYIYRAPRIAGILICLFVGMFALDVFSENGDIGQMLLGFLIHAAPAIILGAVLALAWRWDWIGFVAFLAAALFFLTFFNGELAQTLNMLFLFSGPMALIAALFFVNWKWKKELRQA